MNQPLNPAISKNQKYSFLMRLGLSILLLNLLVLSLTAFSLQQSRKLYEGRAMSSTQDLAKLLEENIHGELEKIDLCLLSIKNNAERYLTANVFLKKEIDPLILRTHSYIPELESLRIADAKGDVVLGTGVVKTVNITDRDYFITLRNNPKAGLVIAKPVVSRMSGKYVLNIARRLNNKDGSFAGVVFAQFTLEHFRRIFSSINIGKNGVITLRDNEMAIIARYPEINGNGSIGNKLISKQLQDKLNSNFEAGSYYTPNSGADNIPRIVSYRKLGNYPLTILVGRATIDFMGDWWKDAYKSLLLLVTFLVTTIVFALMFYRRWQKQMLMFDELRSSSIKLEKRVLERTNDLEARNKELDLEITERKQAEAKLNTVSHYTRSLIEASLDPLVTINPEGMITDVNAATEKATGFSRNELIGTDFSSYFSNTELARQGYQQVFREGSVRDYFLELRHRDGHAIPVLYNASLYRDETGHTIGIFAAARDISKRQEAENKLLEATHYTRSLIEASLDPLVTISPNGMITDVNEATEAATGFSRKELIGTDFSNYFTDPDYARAGYQLVFRDGEVRDYPLELRHKNGQTISVLYNASLYKDQTGKTIGIFAAARDITKRKQIEDTLHEQTLQLEQEIADRQSAQEALAVKHLQLEAVNRTLEDRIQNSVNELRVKDKMMIQQSRQAAMGEMINNIAHQWKQPLNNLGLIIQSINYEFSAGVMTLKDMDTEAKKCMDLIS
ncbi:MAG: PAS domain S-box protein, partial [Deltaproteobacteria bacterium]